METAAHIDVLRELLERLVVSVWDADALQRHCLEQMVSKWKYVNHDSLAINKTSH